MFYLVIVFLVISSVQTKAVKVILRHPNNDEGNNTRIIGGQAININDAPWQVAILADNEVICGGSVISNRLILTAAHCVVDSQGSTFKVRAGSTHYRRGGQVRKVSKIAYHASYNPYTNDNDIAIMKLSVPLKLNRRVTPVKIASSNQSKSGFASVTGWGVTRESSENLSPVLREVTVQFLSSNKCRQSYKKKNIKITANMICAGATNGGKDACQGDSGGPLVENDILYGIVSYGLGCGRASFPGIYTSVARERRWIRKAIAII